MPDSIRRVSAAELSRITEVSRSTRASWVKREAIEEPGGRIYGERHVVETAIFALLAGEVETGLAAAAWLDAREVVLDRALQGAPGGHRRLDLLINTKTAALELTHDDREVGSIVLESSGEPHIAIPLAQAINGARAGYWRYARLNKAGKRKRPRSKAQRNGRAESA
jgi:hypothetical protein